MQVFVIQDSPGTSLSCCTCRLVSIWERPINSLGLVIMTSDKIVAISKIVEIRNCKDQLGFQNAKHGILQMFDLALDSRPAAPRARGSPVVVPWARAVAGLSLQLAL